MHPSICCSVSSIHYCACMCLPQVLAPLPIGFAVFLVHLATIPITGTGINPARSFGAAVIFDESKPWHDHVRHPPTALMFRPSI